MTDLANHLKSMLSTLEAHKVKIMEQINYLGANEQCIQRTTVYPMASIEPIIVNGYPVLQFGYEGALPTFKENDYEYISMIRHYYYRATFDSYDYKKLNCPVFNKAMIIFVHYFKDENIRDLDNRNKKYIQDAIRQTGIISSDSWKHVWNMDVGFKDNTNHVQVFVLEQDNSANFYQYLIDNHYNLIQNTKHIKSQSE